MHRKALGVRNKLHHRLGSHVRGQQRIDAIRFDQQSIPGQGRAIGQPQVGVADVVKESQGEHNVKLTIRAGDHFQKADMVVLDVLQSVDILGQPKARIVLMPKIERHHPGAALARLETKIAVGRPDIGQGQAAHVRRQPQLAPEPDRLVGAVGGHARNDFKIMVP